MFQTRKQLVLASASPRRRDFLDMLGLTFTIIPANIDETRDADERPIDYVSRMARLKATDVGIRYPSAWVISADTIVILDNFILTKPITEEDAVKTLMILSGKVHEVNTGFCLHCHDTDTTIEQCTSTSVRFTEFDECLARAYVSTNEPMDKAGAYGIQGIGGALVESISGSYSNVVGLPLAEIVALLTRYRIIEPMEKESADLNEINKAGLNQEW